MRTDLFNYLAADKISHALGGAVITLGLGYFFPWYVAMGAASVVGILKEVYDKTRTDIHTPDAMDALATILGGIAGALIVYVAR